MTLRHTMQALAIALIWGFNFVTILWGLEAFPPSMLAGIRFCLVAIPCCFFIPFPKMDLKYFFIYGFLSIFVQFALSFYALKLGLSPGIASVVLQVQAIFTIIFSVIFLKEYPKKQTIFAMFICFLGLILLGITNQSNIPFFALILAVVAAMAWSSGNIAIRLSILANNNYDMLGLIVWSSALLPIPFFVLSYLLGEKVNYDAINLKVMFSVFFLAWGASIFAYTAWARLLRIYSANVVGPYSLLVPVFGIFFAYVFFNDIPSTIQWVAIILIMAGIIIHSFPAIRKRK